MHIHNPIRNLVQRLDGADEKWRMLDSRALYGAKLGIAADVSCALKPALRAESFHLTARADGNEFEVAGVEHKENDFFSSRRARIGPKIERLVGRSRSSTGGRRPRLSCGASGSMRRWRRGPGRSRRRRSCTFCPL